MQGNDTPDNYVKNFLQIDNAHVHQRKEVKLFLKKNNIRTILWPSKSPDINIVEDVWKLISDIVYDCHQFRNKKTCLVPFRMPFVL